MPIPFPFGGDELIVVAKSTGLSEAQTLAEELQKLSLLYPSELLTNLTPQLLATIEYLY
ncbi:MAG: hypothetical protein GY829_05400 [Gammaproteobacteria bacterium]|nr:hypothetical protein [Gammaproteobacteria bacterium]